MREVNPQPPNAQMQNVQSQYGYIDELRRAQREGMASNVAHCVTAARRKYLNAANLPQLGGAAIERLRALGTSAPIDAWPLFASFTVLSERYIERFFSPQGDLIATPKDKPDEKWGRYFYFVLLPHLLRNDDVVLDALRAVRALPCSRPDKAAEALVHHFTEMTMPESEPAWAPEDLIDH
jgi:hypothetical protein